MLLVLFGKFIIFFLLAISVAKTNDPLAISHHLASDSKGMLLVETISEP